MTEPDERAVWGVRPAILVGGCVIAAVLIALMFVDSATEDRLVAGTALVVVLVAIAAGTRLRERLRLTDSGFRIRGPLGSAEVSWSQVVQVASATRRSRGLSSTSLEIDLDDDGLIILGRLELGSDPAEVGDAVRARWLQWRAR